MGLRSGEYGGRWRRASPARSRASRTAWALWAGRLSRTTIASGRSRPQRRRQDLLDEGQEHRRAGRGGDAHAGDHAVEGERADHGQPLPSAPRHLTGRPPAAPGASVGARHPGVDPGLVDEDQAGGVDAVQVLPPRPPRLGHVLAILLGGPERLFLRTRPSALSARLRAEGLRRTPVRAASRSAYSAKVASFRSATSPANASRSPPMGARPPRPGLGARRPSPRATLSQPESVRSPTRSRRATADWRPSPSS